MQKNTYSRHFPSMTAMMQDAPKTDWAALWRGLGQFKINSAVALAVVLFFAVSAGAITLVAHTEMANSGYEPVFGQTQSGGPQVLGVASYGYNQPVCGRNTANCLNHMLIGYNGNGWQVKIDYQLEKNVIAAIRVNGWPFMDNISGSGSGYTGYDLLPGKNYNFILYRKAGSRLIKITNLNLTAPRKPEVITCPVYELSNTCIYSYNTDENGCSHPICAVPKLNYCAQDAYQCPDGNYVSRTGPNCTFICPTPSYGYAGTLGTYRNDSKPVPSLVKAGSYDNILFHFGLRSILGLGTPPGTYVYSLSGITFEVNSSQTLNNLTQAYLVDEYANVVGKWDKTASPGPNWMYFVFSPAMQISAGETKELTFKASLASFAEGDMSFKEVGYALTPGYTYPQSYQTNGWWSHPVKVEPTTESRVGKLVYLNGTVLLVGENGVYGIPSLDVFNSWGWSFGDVLSANQVEKALRQVGVVPSRNPYCNSALDQIQGKCPVEQQPVSTKSDSDNSPNYLNIALSENQITQSNYPDLFIRGVAKGSYVGTSSNQPCEYGSEPNPTFCKPTSETFTTYTDHCASTSQLNEGYIDPLGRLQSVGISPPTGYVCSNGAFVKAASNSSNSANNQSTSSGSAAYPSYRYIKIETPQSDSWASWREIEIYGTDGQKITPVSSAVSGIYASSVGSRAYDGNSTTAWISGSYSNSHIILDLGSDKQISKVRLLPANYPSPATATHKVLGRVSSETNFLSLKEFGPQIADNQWLTFVPSNTSQ